MALLLGQASYGVRKRERSGEVFEAEIPLETLNALSFHECPIGDFSVQRSAFLRRDSRGPALAGLTFHVFQFAHIRLTLEGC